MSTEQPIGSPGPATSTTPAGSAGSAMHHAHRAEASGELVAMSFPGARRVAGWLFWVVFPLLCLGALALAVLAIVDHVGNQPKGTRGTYVANRTCARGICLVGGTFTSDDGRIKVNSLLGDPRWATGTEHQVFYDGTGVEVVGVVQWDPTPSVLAGVGAVTYLGVVAYFLRAARRDPEDVKHS